MPHEVRGPRSGQMFRLGASGGLEAIDVLYGYSFKLGADPSAPVTGGVGAEVRSSSRRLTIDLNGDPAKFFGSQKRVNNSKNEWVVKGEDRRAILHDYLDAWIDNAMEAA